MSIKALGKFTSTIQNLKAGEKFSWMALMVITVLTATLKPRGSYLSRAGSELHRS